MNYELGELLSAIGEQQVLIRRLATQIEALAKENKALKDEAAKVKATVIVED